MKKAILVILMTALYISFAISVFAEQAAENPVNFFDVNSCTLSLNGQKAEIGYLYINEEAYLNLRDTIQTLEGRVYWYDIKKQICIVLGNVKVFIDLREGLYMRNGIEFTLDQGLKLIKGQNYLSATDLINMMAAH